MVKFTPLNMDDTPAGKPVTTGPVAPLPTEYTISVIAVLIQVVCASDPVKDKSLMKVDSVLNEMSSSAKSLPPAAD